MSANVDCAIGDKPHPPHALAGGKPMSDKRCDGTPDDEAQTVSNDRAESEAIRQASTKRERLYGEDAPTLAECDGDERWGGR